MKIKTHLTINFTLLVAGILTIFSACVYLFYSQHKQENFIIRLRDKAINTATLYFDVKSINNELIKKIESNIVTSMNDLTVIVLDKSYNILYSNRDSTKVKELMPFFNKLNWGKNSNKFFSEKLFLCIKYSRKNKEYFVLASASDLYGQQELNKLLIIIVCVFVASIFFIFLAGYLNSTQSLMPIKEVIEQVDDIKASNLSSRLDVKNNDEIAELASTFNKMLDRIENAFETERTFVSNASHELRTPITSIKGQVEVGIARPRSAEEYKSILASILDDVQTMTNIINGFLELAETNIEPGTIKFIIIRMDELLFSVKEDIMKKKPGYFANIEFENIPKDESEITVLGSVRLLKILMFNLIDNACKFSENKKATIKIAFDLNQVILKFVDNGIGIPKNELEKVFQPLYRAKNVTGITGNGIGLSIVKKIVDLHGGNIVIESEVNVGTTVSISLKNNTLHV